MARRIQIPGPRNALRWYQWRGKRVRASRAIRGATRTGRVVQVLRGNSGRPVASVQVRGVMRRTAPRALGQRGEMIALRGRFPVPRGSLVQTFYGPLPAGARGIRGAGTPRTEGRGEDPSKRAYRNSARYRERHGLGA